MSPVPVVDLFAGPGGLNEGFSSLMGLDGSPVFEAVASFEMDGRACDTLRLRSAVRMLRGSTAGSSAYLHFLHGDTSWSDLIARPEVATALSQARGHVHQVELGPSTREESRALIREALSGDSDGPWVLIGGPPCQAYSLVGRARRTHDANFDDDVKHFLYREYLDIIEAHRPPVFVMENVKGLLSHTHRGRHLFGQILDDLSRAGDGYDIRSFVVPGGDRAGSGAELAPSDYVIRSEAYGVPQRRHRVILLGVRSDISARPHQALRKAEGPSVRDVLGGLPAVRSQISPKKCDDESEWRRLRAKALTSAGVASGRMVVPSSTGWERGGRLSRTAGSGTLASWLTSRSGGAVVHHQARSHMPNDLMRYAYLAARAHDGGRAIKVDGLPPDLLPRHANIGGPNTPFADRFRVQRFDGPATTVTSHIAKDGHYYIHPDPSQMRSLTVREAARIQTFPDDYFFCGNRTQQYHQVGNAVPPYLAYQLAEVVAGLIR